MLRRPYGFLVLALLVLASTVTFARSSVARCRHPKFPEKAENGIFENYLHRSNHGSVLSGRMQAPCHCSNFPPHQLSTLRSSHPDAQITPWVRE